MKIINYMFIFGILLGLFIAVYSNYKDNKNKVNIKKINWVQEKDKVLLGKIGDYELFTVVQQNTYYTLWINIPSTENEQVKYMDHEGHCTIDDISQEILINKAELMYKTFYESIK